MTTELLIWYWISSLLLAAILYKPTKKLIFVRRVRRAERKLKRETTQEERTGIEKKTIPVTVAIVITFSFIFNKIIIFKYFR